MSDYLLADFLGIKDKKKMMGIWQHLAMRFAKRFSSISMDLFTLNNPLFFLQVRLNLSRRSCNFFLGISCYLRDENIEVAD